MHDVNTRETRDTLTIPAPCFAEAPSDCADGRRTAHVTRARGCADSPIDNTLYQGGSIIGSSLKTMVTEI